MIKNGLFLASIGMLILMCRQTLEYDMLNLATALFMIIFGGVLAYKGTKKEKAKETTKEEVGK